MKFWLLVGDTKSVPRLGRSLRQKKKKSARFLEIIAGRLHPESERGEGARALKTALGWAKDASQAPLIHLVLLDLFFFFFFK